MTKHFLSRSLFLGMVLVPLAGRMPANGGQLSGPLAPAMHALPLQAAGTKGEVTQSKQLPPRIAALVPQGTKLDFSSFIKSRMVAEVTFNAIKDSGYASKSNPRPYQIVYRLHLYCYDASLRAWKTLEPVYRGQMRQDSDRKRQEMAKILSHSGVTYDPPTTKEYGWGTGLTQRVAHHELGVEGARTPPDVISYNSAYFGMIGGVIFDLTVSGMPDSPAEADQWAGRVADQMGKISYANIGD